MINTEKLTPYELQQKAFEILTKNLGISETIRFIHQYEKGKGDYTKEKYEKKDSEPINDIIRRMRNKNYM